MQNCNYSGAARCGQIMGNYKSYCSDPIPYTVHWQKNHKLLSHQNKKLRCNMIKKTLKSQGH